MTDRSFNLKLLIMPRSQEQLDDIRKQKKKLIIGVALELFAENGYHASSISQISQKAGISKGLIYNYFQSKKEILDELIADGFNEIYDNFDFNKDGILTEEEFVYFIRQNFKMLRDNMQHWKLFFSLLLQPQVTETFAIDYKEKGEPIFKMLYTFLKLKGSADPEGDLMVISAMLEGAFLYAVTATDIFPMEIMEEKIINACFKIIKG